MLWKSVFLKKEKVKYCSSNFFFLKKKVILCYVCYIAVAVPAATYSSVYRAVAFCRYVSFLEKLVTAFAYFLCRAFNVI